ncbi:MAG: PAS domain S-box protein [Dehalococcoidia bacterium]|nr:PAS domain S-box protein [Dehalococcoidia bacterium]
MAEKGKQKQTKPDESLELAQALMRCAGTGIYIVQDGKFQYVNALFQELTGYSETELLGKYSLDLVHPDDREKVREKAVESLKVGSSLPYEYRFVKKDGEIIWVLEKVTSTEYRGKRATVGSFMDITERKRLEEAIKKSGERYRTMLEEIQDTYFEVDLAGNFTFVNDALCRIMGYSKEELIGMNYRVFAAKEDVEVIYRDFNRVYHTGETIKGISYRFVQKNGTVGFGELSISAIKNEEGQVIAFRGIGRDVTERKRLEQELNHIATHDFLTGLPNRVLLQDRLNVGLNQAQRNNANLAVMMLDLDRFKVVNDTLGHSIGDKLLMAAGERLSDIVRKSDTVARVGGDEFLVLLPQIAKIGDATKVARKILEAFGKPFVVDSYQTRVTTSIGIAFYPEDGDDADALLTNADTAMYWVKEHGRDDYAFYSVSKAKIS